MATPITADPANPFRYGWRAAARRAPDGTITWDRVPLTLTDVLHPQLEDTLVHSEPHERCCAYLYDVFRVQLAGDPTAVVLHDVGIEWDEPNLRPHSPDLSVILGVRE